MDDHHMSMDSQSADVPAAFNKKRAVGPDLDSSAAGISIHNTPRQQAAETKPTGALRLRIARVCYTDNSNNYIMGFDRILRKNARRIANLAGMDYDSLVIADRLILTRFRCSVCGDLPFYFLDTRHVNRMRCGKCSGLISLKNTGKYGRLRKMIAISACREIDAILYAECNNNNTAIEQMR